MYQHRFQKKACDKFDLSAKNVLIKFLEQLNFTDIKIYDEVKNGFVQIFDMIAYRNGKKFIFEVGVKQDWGTKWYKNHEDIKYSWETKRAPFPYPDVHELFRKGNTKDNTRLNVTHNVIMGGDYKRLVIIPRKVVLNSEVIQKKCKNIPAGEVDTFFSIPVTDERLYWCELHDEKWFHILLKDTPEINFSYLDE